MITGLRLLMSSPWLVLAVCRLLNLETLVAEVVTVLVVHACGEYHGPSRLPA